MFFLFDVSVLEEEPSKGAEATLGMVKCASDFGAGVGGGTEGMEVEDSEEGLDLAASSDSFSLAQSVP